MIQISPGQFQQYQQQWNQAVEDGDLGGQRQKKNAAYWLAYCYRHEEGGVRRQFGENIRIDEQAVQILEQVIQEQDQIDDGNIRDGTGKHRYWLAVGMSLHANQQFYDPLFHHPRADQLFRQAVPRLEAEVQAGGNDKNFQEAAENLGQCLFFGHGVDKDPSRGIHWWKAAAELGHKHAQHDLFCYCSRDPQYAQYAAEVFDWWLGMAGTEHGHAWAQMALGNCFGYG